MSLTREDPDLGHGNRLSPGIDDQEGQVESSGQHEAELAVLDLLVVRHRVEDLVVVQRGEFGR